MQKKKMPVGMVIGLVILVAIGVIVNGGDGFRAAMSQGNKPQPVTELKGQEMSDAQRDEQRSAMQAARANRGSTPGTGDIPEKPALLMEPPVANRKQAMNEAATAGQWFRKESAVDKKREETEALRSRE